MPARQRFRVSYLSDQDRVIIRFETDRRWVVEYAVQHEALINGRWHKIVRYDNAHGEAHKHVFYPDGSKKRFVVNAVNHNQAFTDGYEAIKANFKQLRERYIILTNERNRP